MPTEVPGYVLHSVIGSGATAEVWRAEPVGAPGRIVAVKRLAVPPDRDLVAALRREADALDRLSHPNVLRLLDVVPDRDGTSIALVTPLATGGSLASRLAQSPHGLAAADVADIGARLAKGLAAAHDAGFVHGDVKPPNVLFDAEGQPLLADLGLATMRGLPTSVAGSAGYLDPAVAVDGHPPDVAADVYALGATLFEALCGRPPVIGDDPDQILARAATGDLPSIGELVDVPAALAATVDRALARQPGARHATAHDLAAELDEHARRLMYLPTGDLGPPPPPRSDAHSDTRSDAPGDAGGDVVGAPRGDDDLASRAPRPSGDELPAAFESPATAPHGTRAFGPTGGGSARTRDDDGDVPGLGERSAGSLGATPKPAAGRRGRPRPAAAIPGPSSDRGGGSLAPPDGRAATGRPDPTSTRAFGPRPPATPSTEPAPARGVDRRLLVVAAVLAVVVPVGLVIWLVNGGGNDTPDIGATTSAQPDPEADAPATTERSPAPVCDDTDPDILAVNGERVQLGDLVGRGCSVPVAWDGEQLTVAVPGGEPERYDLSAEPTDVLLLGDFTCVGHDVPALYRPSTGQLFVFEGLADHDEELTASTEDTGVADGVPRVIRTEDGCDMVEVQPG